MEKKALLVVSFGTSYPETCSKTIDVIEEMLKQRIIGVKNEKGVYITPAFPKLIYVLEPDNIEEGTKYLDKAFLIMDLKGQT